MAGARESKAIYVVDSFGAAIHIFLFFLFYFNDFYSQVPFRKDVAILWVFLRGFKKEEIKSANSKPNF